MQKPFQLTGVDRETKYSSQWKFFSTHSWPNRQKKILFKKLFTLENQGTKGKNCE